MRPTLGIPLIAFVISAGLLFSPASGESASHTIEYDLDRLRFLMEAANNMHPDDQIELIIDHQKLVWRRRFHSRPCAQPETAYSRTTVVIFNELRLVPRKAVFDRVMWVDPKVPTFEPVFTEFLAGTVSIDLADILSKVPDPFAKSAIYEESCAASIKRLDRVRSYYIAQSGQFADEVESLILRLRAGSI